LALACPGVQAVGEGGVGLDSHACPQFGVCCISSRTA
jgi:hypothetical protein